MNERARRYWPSNVGIAILAVVFMGFGAMLFWALAGVWRAAQPMPIGSIAEWFAAAGTIGATWAAVAAARRSYELASREIDARRDAELAQDRIIAFQLFQVVGEIRTLAARALRRIQRSGVGQTFDRPIALAPARDYLRRLEGWGEVGPEKLSRLPNSGLAIQSVVKRARECGDVLGLMTDKLIEGGNAALPAVAAARHADVVEGLTGLIRETQEADEALAKDLAAIAKRVSERRRASGAP